MIRTVPNLFTQAALGVLLLQGAHSTLAAQVSYMESMRSLVQRVQEDLQKVRDLGARNEKNRERIDNALKHLSDFDRNLVKNKFDKDRLNEAIDDLKNVVENNSLQARDRDILTADLGELRAMRETRR